MNNYLYRAGVIAVVLIFFLFAVQCSNEVKVTEANKQYAGLDSNVHYVGMGECRQCHQNIYETYMRTGMGKSFDVVSRKKSAAEFSEHSIVYDKYKNLSYKPFWNNDSLYILEYRLKGKDTTYRNLVGVNYIIGSGQHTNSHIYNINGYFYQAPLTYYTQQGTWDLPPGFENGQNSRFGRIIGLECMSCHNGYPEFTPGSENKYDKVPNGIDCERCHGPGGKHIADKKAGLLVDVTKEIDYTIVNPSKLPIDLQFDVCQRCHIQGNAVLNDGKSFYDYKPGMKLSEVMNVFMPVYKGMEEEHIMASHAERLKQSKCYLKTTENISSDKLLKLSLKPYKEALTCVTCHNPHVSRLETAKETFNNACSNCHNDVKKNTCSEKQPVLKRMGFNCVACHMPENKTVDIPHVKVHDHRIMIPFSKAEKKKVKEFIGIVAVNNPQPDRKSVAKAYINYYEKFGYGPAFLDTALTYIDKRSSTDIKKNIGLLVHVFFLKQDYAKVVEYVKQCNDLLNLFNKQSLENEDAWMCYRIAEAFNSVGENSTALKYYQQSYNLAPLTPKFGNEYAQYLAINGKYKEAIAIFEKLIQMQPKFAPPYCNLSFIYLSAYQNISKADQLIDLALIIDPDYEAALMNKASILLLQKKRADAIIILKRVMELNPSNTKARLALKQI